MVVAKLFKVDVFNYLHLRSSCACAGDGGVVTLNVVRHGSSVPEAIPRRSRRMRRAEGLGGWPSAALTQSSADDAGDRPAPGPTCEGIIAADLEYLLPRARAPSPAHRGLGLRSLPAVLAFSRQAYRRNLSPCRCCGCIRPDTWEPTLTCLSAMIAGVCQLQAGRSEFAHEQGCRSAIRPLSWRQRPLAWNWSTSGHEGVPDGCCAAEREDRLHQRSPPSGRPGRRAWSRIACR